MKRAMIAAMSLLVAGAIGSASSAEAGPVFINKRAAEEVRFSPFFVARGGECVDEATVRVPFRERRHVARIRRVRPRVGTALLDRDGAEVARITAVERAPRRGEATWIATGLDEPDDWGECPPWRA